MSDVVLRAARKIEDSWRRRKTVPCCPHCKKAILPDSNFGAHRVRVTTDAAKQGQVIEYMLASEGIANVVEEKP